MIQSLISEAKKVYGPQIINDEVTIGEVGAALLTTNGNIYTGISIAAPCGIGFCAEHSAIAEMLKNGEKDIKLIVAVRGNHVLPPCGRCRELIRQISRKNYTDCNVIISSDKCIPLSDLLPLPF